MLYFAYGMNTNRSEMAQRCPGALSLGHARLVDRIFRFATHADVVKCRGSYVDGVLWTIDDFHLNALDRLEGYPYYYNRRSLRVAHNDRIVLIIALNHHVKIALTGQAIQIPGLHVVGFCHDNTVVMSHPETSAVVIVGIAFQSIQGI